MATHFEGEWQGYRCRAWGLRAANGSHLGDFCPTLASSYGFFLLLSPVLSLRLGVPSLPLLDPWRLPSSSFVSPLPLGLRRLPCYSLTFPPSSRPLALMETSRPAIPSPSVPWRHRFGFRPSRASFWRGSELLRRLVCLPSPSPLPSYLILWMGKPHGYMNFPSLFLPSCPLYNRLDDFLKNS